MEVGFADFQDSSFLFRKRILVAIVEWVSRSDAPRWVKGFGKIQEKLQLLLTMGWMKYKESGSMPLQTVDNA